ncbi:MAG: ComF family protein [Candidatus Omnitrophica bacterium]|nr:ComF family protein [Candidatus Omnitrophota bacterium]
MVKMLKTILESFINIVYPPICVTCNKPNGLRENQGLICHECYYGIKRHIPPFCLKCGRGLNSLESISSGVCRGCAKKHYYFDQAYSMCVYDGPIKELIHRFKYNYKLQYKTVFENLLKEFLQSFNVLRDIDLIIPIPLHPVKLREREYNQSQILAAMASQILQKPVGSDILSRSRNTKPQIDLKEEARMKNIHGCFTVKNGDKVKSKQILLVDDVLTTGTTLSEAARMLKQHQPEKICVLTLAS